MVANGGLGSIFLTGMSGADNSPEENLARSLSEERIRRVTIGEPRVLDGPIRLQEYNARWPMQFGREVERIRGALGDRALRIEHIGSTSVPGLVAKPIIDILLVVVNSAEEASYVPALEAAGYRLRIREPEWHEHRLFKGPEVDVNLHVFTAGSVEIERLLLLRERLRSRPEERELYAQAKQRLASRPWKYVQDYADAKSEVIEGIIARGRAGQ
ncbi:MAG TPA: GrpB family protein [Candidatus Limnocylindrales bacterium]|nr:GrpB family protein [Candidatus Limnocylindrales bacterium]